MNTNNQEWASRFFTFGHLAKGFVYIVIGGFALATVIGNASGPSGPKGVIQFLNNQPFGQVLLALLGIGLISYCLWRWIKAFKDPYNEGSDASGMVKRIAWFSSGTFYGLLAVYAFSIVIGSGSSGSGGGENKQSAVGKLLTQPFGEFLVYALAVIFLGTGVYQLYRGLKEKYMDRIEEHKIGHDKAEMYRKFGKAGHVARAIIFGIISYFLFLTGMSSDASKVRGVEGALQYLQENQYGFWLLGIVGLGMLLYGIFMFIKARYHQMSR